MTEIASAGSNLIAPTDTLSNSWTQIGPASVTNVELLTYWAVTSSSGADTVTMTSNPAEDNGLSIYEVSGLGAVVGAASASGTCSTACTTSISTSALSWPANVNYIVISSVGTTGTGSGGTAGSSFTLNTVNSNEFLGAEYSTTVSSSTTSPVTAGTAPTVWAELGSVFYTKYNDGSCGNIQNSGTSVACSISTTQAVDVVIAAVTVTCSVTNPTTCTSPPTVSSLSGGSLTWTNRNNVATSTSIASHIYEYSAVTSSALSSASITASFSGTATGTIEIFAIDGVPASSQFDGNGVTNTGNSASASASITTTNANDVIIGLVAQGAKVAQASLTSTVASGFTEAATVESTSNGKSAGKQINNALGDTEFEYFTTTQSGLSVSFTLGTSGPWEMVADAIKISTVQSLNAALTERVSPNDTSTAPVRRFTGFRTASDTGLSSISDTITRLRTSFATMSDSLSAIADSLSRAFTGSRGITESASPTDSISRVLTALRTITDTNQPSIAIDGSGTCSASSSSCNNAVTTSNTKAIFIVFVEGQAPSGLPTCTAPSDTAGLSYTLTASQVPSTSSWQECVYYSTRWASSGSNTITCSETGATNAIRCIEFGVDGTNPTQPIDPNAAVPCYNPAGSSTSVSCSISTSNPHDMLIGLTFAFAGTSFSGGSFTIITSFTGSDPHISADYLVVSSTQSGTSISESFTGSVISAMIGIAVEGTSSPVSDSVSRLFTGVRGTTESIGVSLADSISRQFSGARGITESLSAITDSVSRLYSGFRGLSESISALADSVTGIKGSSCGATFCGTLTESVSSLADSLSRLFAGNRGVSESASPTDTIARLFTGSRGITESLSSISDSLSRLFVGSRSISESTAALGDSISRLFTGSRSVSESSAPTDVISRIYSGLRTATETLSALSDSVSRLFAGSRTTSDTTSALSDSVSRLFAGTRGITESVTPTATIARLYAGLRSMADSISAILDSVTRTLGASRNISDSVSAISDSAARLFQGTRSVSEAPTISDTVARFYAGIRGISESIASLLDSISVVFQQGSCPSTHCVTISDTALTAISDTASRLLNAVRTTSETVSVISDSVSRLFSGARSTADTISALSDAVTRLATMLRGVGESITPTDTVTRLFNGFRTTSDTISAISDSASRLVGFVRGLTEQSTPTDVISRLFNGVRSTADTLTAMSDSVSRLFGGFRTTSDTVSAISDSTARVVGFVRGITEQVTPTDVVSRLFNGIRTIGDTISQLFDSVTASSCNGAKYCVSIAELLSVSDIANIIYHQITGGFPWWAIPPPITTVTTTLQGQPNALIQLVGALVARGGLIYAAVFGTQKQPLIIIVFALVMLGMVYLIWSEVLRRRDEAEKKERARLAKLKGQAPQQQDEKWNRYFQKHNN